MNNQAVVTLDLSSKHHDDSQVEPEEVTFDSFKPDPDDTNIVAVFSVSKEDAEAFGAIEATEEELKSIGVK